MFHGLSGKHYGKVSIKKNNLKMQLKTTNDFFKHFFRTNQFNAWKWETVF